MNAPAFTRTLAPFALAAVTALGLVTLTGCGGGGGTGGGGGGGDESTHALKRKAAPDGKLKTTEGEAVRVADFKGKVLIVDYWATWCGPCKASFPKIDALYKKHKDEGLEVVAINENDEPKDMKAIAEFVKETGASFTIALDSDGKLASKYAVETMPSTFVIDRSGVVRYVHAGYHDDEAEKLEKEVSKLLAEEKQ
jgi:cytochrome c biogenesis protein CcmG/thiol:disulfide interchange protein DsbE